MKRTINVHVKMANLMDSKATKDQAKGGRYITSKKPKKNGRDEYKEVSDATQKRPMSRILALMMTASAFLL